MTDIVPFGPAHADAVMAIERQCFSAPWGLDSLMRTISSSNALTLVALSGVRPVGYASALMLGPMGPGYVPPEAEILKVAVLPEMREQGIGRRLAGSLINMLRKKGVEVLHLEVRESNRAARILYESCGFRHSGRRPDYYSGPREDAVLMTLRLR
jgi:ribosomal-protein-alanine N-acetyltransferase